MDKKKQHGHISQCGFEKKHVDVCVWVDFEKRKRKKANIVCCVQVHGQRVQMTGEFKQYDLKSWSGE